MKIAKVYEDGMFLGYLSETPDTEPTYDRNKAKKFKSGKEAEKEFKDLYDNDVFCFDKFVMEEANLEDAPLQTQIENFIYNWVGKNYGESEMREPAWNIELLAKEITKQFKQN